MTLSKILYPLLTVVLLISSIACSSIGKKPPEESYDSHSSDQVEQQLLGAAQSIERSLASLAEIREANHPPVLNTAPLVTPEGGMGGEATIDWTGPIEPLLNTIAEMANYRLKTYGVEPTIPIIVSITQHKAVIADILKNTSLQAGNKANILVFPANKIIELRYQNY